MTKVQKVGIVGFGQMGRNHARVLQQMEAATLVVIVDPELSKFSESWNSIPVVSDVSELQSFDIDYCVVSVPTSLHSEICTLLLSRDIPMLIEKPLADCVENAAKIQSAMKPHVLVAVGHVENFNPAVIQARSRILQGEIGKIHQIVTSRIGPFPRRITDVGVIFDLASHDFGLTMFLTGEKYHTVSSTRKLLSNKKHEDIFLSTGTLSGGTIYSHVVNWLSPIKERKIRITGSLGLLEINTLNSELLLYKNGENRILQRELAHFQGVTQGDVISFAFEKQEPLWNEHMSFIQELNGMESANVNVNTGLAIVEVADSMILSAQSGQTLQMSS
jgi:UDP-N-acetylglucosamine 3-dehydrogenase